MASGQKSNKILKTHQGLVIARWFWIFIGAGGGIILRTLRESELTPLTTPSKLFGLTAVQIFATLLLLFNSILTVYIFSKRFNRKITSRGYKILNFLQVYVDLIIFMGFFFFSGGIESPGTMSFFIPLIISIIVYRQTGIIITAITTIIMFSTAVFTQYYAITHPGSFLPYYHAYSENNYQFANNLIITIYFYYNFIMVYAGAAIFGSLASKIIKNYENDLIVEKDKTASAINGLIEGIIVYTPDNKITLANPMAKDLLKIKQDDIIGQTINSKVVKKFPLLHKVLQLRPSLNKEVINIDQPNKLSLQVSTVPINNSDNQAIGFMKVIQDITREQEIDHLKTEFISVVSHQLRTPLSAIKWTIKMMLDKDLGPTTKEQEKFLHESFTANEQMIRLVNDLLNISRIEEGRFLFDMKIIQVEDAVKEAMEESSLLIEKIKTRNIRFEYENPPIPMPPSKIDKEKMKVAITNLLENAANYTKKGSIKIKLWYDEKEKTNNIEIKDTGIGIPKADKINIFKKFYRGSNISKASQGTGLGLFLVKNVAEKHGGTITLQSEKGKGTSFILSLPALAITQNVAQKQKTAKFSSFLRDI